MDTVHYEVIITVGCAIFGVLVAILGFLVKATIRWTIVTTKLTAIEATVTSLTTELVKAVTRDNDHETRIQLLEKGGRH